MQAVQGMNRWESLGDRGARDKSNHGTNHNRGGTAIQPFVKSIPPNTMLPSMAILDVRGREDEITLVFSHLPDPIETGSPLTLKMKAPKATGLAYLKKHFPSVQRQVS